MSQVKETLEQLTDQRIKLSVIENSINRLTGIREISLAFTSAQKAFMWLGVAKGALGAENPYPESRNPESKQIEPRAEDSKEVLDLPYGDDRIAAVKALRAELKTIEELIKSSSDVMTTNKWYQHAIAEAYTNCKEAAMWLGQELGSIKKQAEFDRVFNEIESIKKRDAEESEPIKKSPVETAPQSEVLQQEASEPAQDTLVESPQETLDVDAQIAPSAPQDEVKEPAKTPAKKSKKQPNQ